MALALFRPLLGLANPMASDVAAQSIFSNGYQIWNFCSKLRRQVVL